MNIQKPAAIAAAMLITAAGMAAIASYSNAAMASATRQGADASTAVIRTLPAVNVHPTREQIRELHEDKVGAAPANLRMPYYSFASDSTGV
jgi:hypothetical protein